MADKVKKKKKNNRKPKQLNVVPDTGYLPVEMMQRMAGLSQDTGYMSLQDIRQVMSSQGGAEYMSVESLHGVFERDGGYITTGAMQAMIREAEDTGYLTTDGMQELLSRMKVSDAYFVPDASNGDDNMEGVYMTTEGTREVTNPTGDSYISVDQADAVRRNQPGTYEELPGTTDSNYQEPPVTFVDGGYQEPPGQTQDGVYQEPPGNNEKGYDELPTTEDGIYGEPELGTSEDDPHAISVNGILTPKQKKAMEKARIAKEKAEENAKKRGAKEREKLLKQSLKRENTAKRRASKQIVKEQKEMEKQKKKEAAREKKKEKEQAQQQLNEAKRRMTASKLEFKNKKKSGAINLDDERLRRETMSTKLKEGAARAAALDREEATKKFMSYPQNQRFLATRDHRTSKEGYLDFATGQLIIVLQKPDNTAWFGLNVKTNEKGVFLPECVVLADT